MTDLGISLSPQGTPRLDILAIDAGPIDEALALELGKAFARGAAHGVLALGAVPAETELSLSAAHLRALARIFLAAAAKVPELETDRDGAVIPVPDALEAWRLAAPPMTGAEYLSADAARTLFESLSAAFKEEWATAGGSLESFLSRRGSVSHLVGRVYFHLAENKRDQDAPFAFLATYTTRLSAKERLKHLPLGKALDEYAGAKNKAALLSLLAPIQRATEKSALLRAMVESEEIYHPLAWTPAEAHAFLGEAPAFEASGIVLRLPDWWRGRSARPEVRVSLGKGPPSTLGQDALLDFSVEVALDGEALTREEWEQLRQSPAGLVSLRGRWVEVDQARLKAVLDHWRTVEKDAGKDGLSFLAGMRLLAGAEIGGPGDTAVSPEVREWSTVSAGEWLTSALSGARDAAASADPGPALKATLRPYQQAGVRWLATMTHLRLGACLADDMGLGKTVQVIALLLLLAKEPGQRRPSLLVMPASLLGNWKSELARFGPSLRAFFAHPAFTPSEKLEDITAKDLAETDVVLTTYGALHRMAWLGRVPWEIVVLDEAQAIKNPGAKQTRAAKALDARMRIALTGTPVENRTGDLYSLFDFLAPGLLGTAKQFSLFTKRLAKDPRGYAPLRNLVKPYLLRRLKTDKSIVDDLPDKTEVKAFCPLTKEQAVLYQDTVLAMKKALETAEGIERRGVVLSFLMRFKQVCNHPSQARGDGVFGADASGKFLRLRELAETMAERQEKVLVFTQFREMTGPIEALLESVFGRKGLVLHGETAIGKRKALVDAFQSEGGPPFFVLSLKAGGTGLNLTAASHVVHFDRWWNPAVENQATDRAYRIGQKKNVLVHKFVCKGTLEEKIDEMLEGKKALAEQIVEAGGEVSLTEMGNEELVKLVALDWRGAVGEG